MDDRKLVIGIGAVCATALVGWGLISLVSGSGVPQAQRAAMAAAPSTVGLGSSGSRLAGVNTRSGTRVSRRKRTSSKRVRQATHAPVPEARTSSLAERRGNPRLP
jgi:hypothetical protein